jgi:photosystem II stability/assembly factor-like uncharacterized protein
MRKLSSLALLFLLANLSLAQLKWNWAHPQPQGNEIRWIRVWDANTWYAVGYSQTFMKTSNGGTTWTISHDAGWPQTSTATSQQNNINTAWFFNQSSGFVGGQGQGIARTLNGGATWDTIRILQGTTVGGFNGFHFLDATTGFLAGNTNVRVMKTVNGGLTWTQLPNIPSATYNDVYAPDTNNIFAASSGGRIIHTSNAGATWDTIATGSTSTITDLEFVSPSLAYAAGNPARLAYSTNGGLAWTSVTPPTSRGIQKLKVEGSKVFLVGDFDIIYTTTNNGASWDSIRFTTSSQFPSFFQYAFDKVGNTMVIGGALGLINNSQDNGATWQNKNQFLSQVNGNSVFAFNGSSDVWMVGTGGDILYSSNGGSNWSLRTSGVTTTLYRVHFSSRTVGFIGGDGGVLRKTTDGGLTWTAKSYPSPTHRVSGIDFVNATTGWACGGLPPPTPAGSIAKTTDAGETWVAQTPITSGSFAITIDMIDQNNGWYLGQESIVGRTTDGGTTWTNSPTPSGFTGSALKAFDINTAIVTGTGTSSRIYKTTNGGTTWEPVPAPTLPGPFSVTWFATDWVSPTVGIVAGSSGLSARTTNGGLTWSPVVWTGGNQTVRGLVMTAPDTAFCTAGTGGSGSGGHVFKYARSLTDAQDMEAGIPTRFALSQNYPNPFNPTTTISFALPTSSYVRITICNIIGQEVATVVEGVREPGVYSQQWYGRDRYGNHVATGVYFYRIEAKPVDRGTPFTSMKKMLLIK